MLRILLFFATGLIFFQGWPQTAVITGSLVDRFFIPLAGVAVSLAGGGDVRSGLDGKFLLESDTLGEQLLLVRADNYKTLRLPLDLTRDTLELGNLVMEWDGFQTTLNIADEDSGAFESTEDQGPNPLLNAAPDIFSRRVAFDFSQVFFRTRGYRSGESHVILNGFPMNQPHTGRPQWNHWGGLNDVLRNQQLIYGLAPPSRGFGGLLGNLIMDTSPSLIRPGFRFTLSSSNRNYRGRTMATYNSGPGASGWAYTFSASRRWAGEGYVQGTLYDAYSIYGSLEKKLNDHNTILFTAFLASNRRGGSSALSEEVFSLLGRRYNPYWGFQQGNLRNARERRIREPFIQLCYSYSRPRFSLELSTLFQSGFSAKSRLGYFNAPNPDPTYYRYLPSYYKNSPIGAAFRNAQLAGEGLQASPQLDWDRLYEANQSAGAESASYVLYEDRADSQLWGANARIHWNKEPFRIENGLLLRKYRADNYASILDLMGSEDHKDVDTFSDTRNDIIGPLYKTEGDKFQYHYQSPLTEFRAYTMAWLGRKKWSAYAGMQLSILSYNRHGRFRNQRFPENSEGLGTPLDFNNMRVRGGFQYALTGRHWFIANAWSGSRAPLLENSYINPRDHHGKVPGLQNENRHSFDFNYELRLPSLRARITAYYSRFRKLTDVGFFYTESGLGSDFVQEVATGIDQLHRGIEAGFEYDLSSSVTLSGVASVGKFQYASDPDITINFDTAGEGTDLINTQGYAELGPASIKGMSLDTGPQTACSIGIDYRDPAYWRVGITANYLARNYLSLNKLKYTSSFLKNPGSTEDWPELFEWEVAAARKQNSLPPVYLLNLTAGKSWLKKGRYLGLFLSVNNLFDTDFKTGGYEQARNGNIGQWRDDNLGGTPSFGPKYWMGYGRTYFLNLSLSL